MIIHNDFSIVDKVEAAKCETQSAQARRLVDYLLMIRPSFTTDIARECAIGNISCAASYIKPALEKRGITITASLPRRRIPNRFGEPSQIHERQLVRLR